METLKQKDKVQCYGSLISPTNIALNIQALQKELKINASSISNENVPNKALQIAAEMFAYLNFCVNEEFGYIVSLYENIFTSLSPKDIIFAMTNIHQSSPKTSAGKVTAKVLDKMTKILNFQHSNIDNLLAKSVPTTYKDSFLNCKLNSADEFCINTLNTLGPIKTFFLFIFLFIIIF